MGFAAAARDLVRVARECVEEGVFFVEGVVAVGVCAGEFVATRAARRRIPLSLKVSLLRLL